MRVDFWYEFASTYSYLAAMRIEALAQERDINLRWRPFLLGPIFAEQGWRNSPFNIFAAKGRNMWRDMERQCARQKLAFRRPDPFPQNSLAAARAALALSDDERPAFSRAVFDAAFAKSLPIADRATLVAILQAQGFSASHVLERGNGDEVKNRLKRENDEARRLGIYGAPTCITEDGEMFWGNDRIEAALDWAMGIR